MRDKGTAGMEIEDSEMYFIWGITHYGDEMIRYIVVKSQYPISFSSLMFENSSNLTYSFIDGYLK